MKRKPFWRANYWIDRMLTCGMFDSRQHTPWIAELYSAQSDNAECNSAIPEAIPTPKGEREKIELSIEPADKTPDFLTR